MSFSVFVCFLGLLHLHRQNVVHGDLALRNILYDVQKSRCAVADFGLAHLANVKRRIKQIPVRWVPPEVLKTKL